MQRPWGHPGPFAYYRPMNRRVVLLSALALAGCATSVRVAPPSVTPAPPPAPPRVSAPSGAPMPELESLYSAVAGRDGLTIQVASNGCTAKGDFAFYVERKGPAVTLSFARKTLDTCKSFAMGKTTLSFSWAELGVEPRTPLFLLNPLVAWTGPGT